MNIKLVTAIALASLSIGATPTAMAFDARSVSDIDSSERKVTPGGRYERIVFSSGIRGRLDCGHTALVTLVDGNQKIIKPCFVNYWGNWEIHLTLP